MPTAQVSSAVSGGGTSITSLQTVTADASDNREITLAVAKTGNITTRTDDNTGTLTMDPGHGFTDGQVIDIYWDGGVQYNAVIGTVSVNSVPFDSGVGDNLPADESEITAQVVTSVAVPIDGDEAELVAIKAEYTSPTSTAKAHATFSESDNTVVRAVKLDANISDVKTGSAATSAYTGDPIAKVLVSNGSATETCTIKLLVLQDSTP